MSDNRVKIFLVEDEFVVREGIKNNVDWAGNGYNFCGEASDGELAYPLIKKLQPDIVITDIKMPFMDGLELSRLIRKEFPKMEIVILSGFAEFEYAKEAIKLGVAGYLTKPIDGSELLKAVDEISRKIEQARSEALLLSKYEQDNEENRRGELAKLFQHICAGMQSSGDIMKEAEELSIDLSAICYNVILLRAQSQRHGIDEYSGSIVETESRLEELAGDKGIIVFDRGIEGKAIIVMADSEEELKHTEDSLLDKIKEIYDEYHQIKYFIGIGNVVRRISDIPKSYESAERAFAYQYLLDNNQIVSNESITDGLFSINNIDPAQVDKVKIDEFLKTGNGDETGYFVTEFFNSVGKNAMESLMFRQYIALDTYFCAANFLGKIGVDKGEIETLDANGNVLKSADDTLEYITRVIKKTISFRDEVSNNRYGEVIKEAIKYIEENYMNEELSLNQLAAHVNISPNHLSMIFSQETGSTFIKYLTDLRIEKAKVLLKTTALRSSDIGNQVGYRDPHYFSFIFKKVVGVTPTNYREGRKNDGENDE
ncbi:MAG: response regulator [Lachnospiraceae bacterium]|nr:response regulator [Lachnospiraceae bacterium]